MAKVLFTRADFDLASKYLSSYAVALVDAAIQDGHQVTDLYDAVLGAEANRKNFDIQIPNHDLFIGFGHGAKSRFTGQDMEVLLDSEQNPEVMSGKVCYLAACQSGMLLGPAMVDKTCKQFYGYQADFVFVYDARYEQNPLDDPYAQPFFDCALVPGYGLLSGKPPKQIYDETIERYNYWWDFWKRQNDPMGDSILTWLNWNRDNFLVITSGDEVYGVEKLSLDKLVLPGIAAGVLIYLTLNNKSF